MPKCRENRKRRLKRNRTHLEHVCHKRYDTLVLKSQGGKNPEYYEVRYGKIMTFQHGHQRMINVRKLTARVRARPCYYALLRELKSLCGNLTVTLPKEMFDAEVQ